MGWTSSQAKLCAVTSLRGLTYRRSIPAFSSLDSVFSFYTNTMATASEANGGTNLQVDFVIQYSFGDVGE